MALKCGIIGLTNIGKTTLFNCISNTKAETTSFAYSTNKSNMGIANVPDMRLLELDKIIKAEKVISVTIDIVDIPGLAKGSNQGEGVGNAFLADIRQTDAIIHVLRCFDDLNLPHVEGSINPVRDKEIIDLELQVKDLELIERKIQRTEKAVKAGDKEAKHGIDVLTRYKNHLENFQNVRTLDISDDDKKWVNDMFLLTDKPMMYVCNVDEVSATTGNIYVETFKEAVKDENAEVLVIAGALEADIAALDTEEDRLAFLQDYGLTEPGVNKLIRSAYRLLNLISFFTVGGKENRAWTIRKGMTAPQAAGAIHSDLERGFIRAEVIKYEDMIKYGTEAKVKEAGKLAIEGKSYIVCDGDILNIRFNV
ncbi:MAG: redox-regulated ATPase YchF [Bacteroidetes bacterium]|nr:redox-regulated ATPase YchF [Bacteroidota bacterium]